MINPTTITNYERTDAELERFVIFCVVVAGKNADWAARTVNRFLNKCPDDTLPMDYIRDMGEIALHNTLVANRVGQYGRISKALWGLAELDLRTCTIEQLESVYGIGPKTARFFIVHSRKDAEHAILDTHVLKWLRRRIEDVPTSTPSRRSEYIKHERNFLSAIKYEFPGMSVADADLLIWLQESGRLDPMKDLPFLG